MDQTELSRDGDEVVLEGESDEEWLRSDAVISLETWL
jgi:hypothetical protein